jgi:hypothetical protein
MLALAFPNSKSATFYRIDDSKLSANEFIAVKAICINCKRHYSCKRDDVFCDI